MGTWTHPALWRQRRSRRAAITLKIKGLHCLRFFAARTGTTHSLCQADSPDTSRPFRLP